MKVWYWGRMSSDLTDSYQNTSNFTIELYIDSVNTEQAILIQQPRIIFLLVLYSLGSVTMSVWTLTIWNIRLILVVLTAFVGNVLVLLTLYNAKDRKVRQNYFMFNLSTADLISGLHGNISLPFQIKSLTRLCHNHK